MNRKEFLKKSATTVLGTFFVASFFGCEDDVIVEPINPTPGATASIGATSHYGATCL